MQCLLCQQPDGTVLRFHVFLLKPNWWLGMNLLPSWSNLLKKKQLHYFEWNRKYAHRAIGLDIISSFAWFKSHSQLAPLSVDSSKVKVKLSSFLFLFLFSWKLYDECPLKSRDLSNSNTDNFYFRKSRSLILSVSFVSALLYRKQYFTKFRINFEKVINIFF